MKVDPAAQSLILMVIQWFSQPMGEWTQKYSTMLPHACKSNCLIPWWTCISWRPQLSFGHNPLSAMTVWAPEQNKYGLKIWVAEPPLHNTLVRTTSLCLQNKSVWNEDNIIYKSFWVHSVQISIICQQTHCIRIYSKATTHHVPTFPHVVKRTWKGFILLCLLRPTRGRALTTVTSLARAAIKCSVSYIPEKPLKWKKCSH